MAAVGVAGVAAGEALVHETSLTCLAPSPSKHDKKVRQSTVLPKFSYLPTVIRTEVSSCLIFFF